MLNILVVHFTRERPLRISVADHLFSFRRYGKDRFHYLNAGSNGDRWFVRQQQFDAIIFHNTFFSARWSDDHYARAIAHVDFLKDYGCPKIAIVQDEFIYTDRVCAMIRNFGMRVVCSVASPSEWRKIYDQVDFSQTRFVEVLTGYLSQDTFAQFENSSASLKGRPIDIGYRAWQAAPSLGRHGRLKEEIAIRFREAARDRGLRTDISTRPEDTKLGNAWLTFLLSCKYTIGVEGGASVLDRDGAIKACTDRFLNKNPKASFDEAERACFPGLDGSLQLFALSPRHLEACATRTCQILVEGRYDGVLESNKHYIPLKRDFSNLEDILDRIEDDNEREAIVENAYHDIVASDRWSYREFVNTVCCEIKFALQEEPHREQRWDKARFLIFLVVSEAQWAWLGVIWWTVRGSLRVAAWLGLSATLPDLLRVRRQVLRSMRRANR